MMHSTITLTPLCNHVKELAVSQYETAWKSNAYSTFMSKAKMSDMGKTQYSFYHAVEAFPRMLSLLASKIARNENRVLVVNNLFEEHGKGVAAGFHTQSFREFLTALGMDLTHLYDENHELFNPAPSRWIRRVAQFISANPAALGAAYLSGIEYLYAGISADIAAAVARHPLHAPQSHYSVHAELDWDHGAELMLVAEALRQCPVQIAEDRDCSERELIVAFKTGMAEFLSLYEDMVLPLEEEVIPIARMPISFFFTREDPAFSAAIAKALIAQENKVSAVVIASGGETVAGLLKATRQAGLPDDVAYVDMNPRQLALCHAKENRQSNAAYRANHVEVVNTEGYVATAGKFEALFALLRQYLGKYTATFIDQPHPAAHSLRQVTPVHHACICVKEANAKLKFILGQLFSNHFLSIVFTDQATAYTSDSFAEHFYNVFLKLQSKQEGFGRQNFLNVFTGQDIPYPLQPQEKSASAPVNADFASMQSALIARPNCNYIDMSNIGDWMPVNEFKQLLDMAYHNCTHTDNLFDPKKQGVVVVRKLLGDYSLEAMVKEAGFFVINCNNPDIDLYDHAEFYSEVIIGVTQPTELA